MMKTILVTGSSGFIGYHLCKRLLDEGHHIVGLDSENEYYDVTLKQARRHLLEKYDNFDFYHSELENIYILNSIFEKYEISHVVNLAAYAGVRYSMQNPFPYVQTNIVGFHNILELSKKYKVENFIYASSASIYGSNKPPFGVDDRTDTPLSLYGATKKAGELIAHSYSNLFGIKTTGLRFFNVLGSRGRPDGALFIFTDNIARDKPIQLFNYGKMKRNFTFVGDVVDGIIKSFDSPKQYDIFNLANDDIVELTYFVERIEHELGKKAEINLVEIQPGEIEESRVDISHTANVLGWKPTTNIEDMVNEFVSWYKDFYTSK